MSNKLIINADDYGMSESINQAIEFCLVNEVIDRATLMVRNCREIICIFLESMLIYVMNEFSDSGGHFHGT